jgi:hypothetical protein
MQPEASIKITKLTSVVGSQGVARETSGTVIRSLGGNNEENWCLFLRGHPMEFVSREHLLNLEVYRLHVPAEHLNEKERGEKKRRNARLSTQERAHFEKEMQKEVEKEWVNAMMEEHAKMKVGSYDKFEDFLKMARRIKSPFTRDYTYESSHINKVQSVQITYHNNEFRAVPECIVNAAKKIIVGLDEKTGKRGGTADDGGDGNRRKKKRKLNGMFVATRGGNMIECTHQLSKDTGERESNASDNNKKALTKKVSHLHSSLTGFMSYKSSCDTYNSDQEKKNATGRRNYWDVAHIPNQQVRKLFLLTFGPEKSGMLGKKADEQIAYLTDRGKIGMTFSKVQVDAHLEQMERDLEVTNAELDRLYPDAEPMEEPHAVLAHASDTIETSDDELVVEDRSESIPQEPLLNVIAEDGRPIELLIERSSA